MTKPEIHEYIQHRIDYTAFDVKWMPQSAKFLALGACPDGQGTVEVYELDGSSVNKTQQLPHPRGVRCGTFAPSSLEERNVTTGGFDGKWRIWDIDYPNEPVVCVRGHSTIINCIDGIGGSDGSPAVVTGCKDGSLKVWDPRKPEQPSVVMEPGPEQQKQDCWTVCFGNAYSAVERCVCAGYENGDIKMFDLRNLAVTWEICVKSGVCCLEFDQKSIYMNKLVASGTGSDIHVFDLRTKHPKNGFAQLTHSEESKSTVWAARHLPQDRDIFATCAGSGTVNLWRYQYPEKRVRKASDGCDEGVAGTLTHLCKTSLGKQPVSALDWNADMLGLFVTCTFDQTLHVGFVTSLSS
ncbi:dynein axonemal assembly factor 10 [Amblyomma americanum]